MEIVKKSCSVGREIRAMQQVMFSRFDGISPTITKRIISVRKVMAKFVFAKVTEANPKPVKKSNTNIIVNIEDRVAFWLYKI